MNNFSQGAEIDMDHAETTEDVEKQIDQLAIDKTTRVPQFLPYPEKIIKLTAKPTRKLVLNICGQIGNESFHFPHTDCVPPDIIPSFERLLKSMYVTDRVAREEVDKWRSWTKQKFMEELLKAVPDLSIPRSGVIGFLEAIAQTRINFDINNEKSEEVTDLTLTNICQAFPNTTPEMQLSASKLLISRLPENPVNWRAVLFRPYNGHEISILTVEDFCVTWLAQLRKVRDSITDISQLGMRVNYEPPSKQLSFDSFKKRSHSEVDTPVIPFKAKKLVSNKSESPFKKIKSDLLCTGCGRLGHIFQTCRFVKSLFFNNSDTIPYVGSAGHALLQDKHPGATSIPSLWELQHKDSPDSLTSLKSDKFQKSQGTPSILTSISSEIHSSNNSRIDMTSCFNSSF
jgi:hypothetical protein